MHVNAKRNDYQQAIGRIFGDTPKAVLGAIAVSALTSGGDRLDDAIPLILNEWQILHDNGIVPQPVPAKFRALLRDVHRERQ